MDHSDMEILNKNTAGYVVFTGLLLGFLVGDALAEEQPADRQQVEDRVTLVMQFRSPVEDPKERAQELARQYDGTVRQVYSSAIKGCSLTVRARNVSLFSQERSFKNLTYNKSFSLPGKRQDNDQNDTGKNLTLRKTSGQQIPYGLKRINADQVPSTHPHDTVNVAILDTGIDEDHPDLQENLAGGTNVAEEDSNDWNDQIGHGTHVAGTVAARDNHIGVVGVAPEVNLYSVKIYPHNRWAGDFDDIVAGVDWVAKPDTPDIDVANISTGTVDVGDTHLLHNALKNATKKGTLFVVAAGNSGYDVEDYVPAKYEEVLTVSALNRQDEFAEFSNFGNEIDMIAPGEKVRSTIRDGKYERKSGTSMSAPHITGAAALFVGASEQDVSPEQIMSTLQSRGIQKAWKGDPDDQNEPLIDAKAAAKGTHKSVNN